LRHWSSRRRRRSVALTPLIDVVFLLLIFFVMAGRFAEETRLVLKAAPAGEAASTAEPASDPIVLVGVASDGRLSVAGREISAVQLASTLPQDASVVLRLDPTLPLEIMVGVVDGLRAAGVDRVSYLAPGAT